MATDALKDLAAGSVGGMALVVTGHPFDTLKVRLQTSSQFAGFADCVRQTFVKEGVKGFYKGVASPLVGVSAINGVIFFTRGLAERFVQPNKDIPLTFSELLVAGGITGACVAFVEGPVELVKSKMQVQYSAVGAKYKNTLDCAKQLVTQYGVRGVYQGITATLLRNIPANAAYFSIYEWSKRKLSGNGTDTLSPAAVLTAGGIAGIAYWFTCFPIDVVKSRFQTEPSAFGERQYRNTWDCVKKLAREQGWRGFWRGFTPCALRAFPANAACFFGYETTRSLLGK